MKIRSNNLEEEVYNFKVVHGNSAVYYLNQNNFNYVPTISKDVHVVMITNFPHRALFNKHYANYPEKLNFTCIALEKETFECGMDLIQPLYDFIQTIDSKYILYIDANDTLLVSDIDNPQDMLDQYGCKILFNADDGYPFPDHPCVNKTYVETYAKHHNTPAYNYHGIVRDQVTHGNIQRLQEKVNCAPYSKSLNSGLFLANREYLIESMTNMLALMNDDPTKGYPYGEIENQKMWQYMQYICENGELEIDYLNLFFFRANPRHFEHPVNHWEHFNYFNNRMIESQQ